MSPDLQLQYLEAMGIQYWQERNKPVVQASQHAAEEITLRPEENNKVAEPELVPEAQNAETSLDVMIAACSACELIQNRTQTLIAEGKTDARFMFVVLAPANNAFLSAEASELFTKMLNAIGLRRNEIYLTSLLKCPLNNREARTTELLCCETYLHQQIESVKPELVIALGEKVAQHLLVSKKPLDDLRQSSYHYQNIPVSAMHHPDDLLENPEEKRKAWHDLQKIQQYYGI